MGQFFGTDGIRDVAGQGRLAPDRVCALGQALGVWLHGRRAGARILCGRDTRASGPVLLDQLAQGFLAAGHHLMDGGVLTTPAVQTLCREEGLDLAVVISASHNPADDNGLKFFGPDGRKLPDHAERTLEALTTSALQQALDPPSVTSPGRRTGDPQAGARYLDLVAGLFPDLDLDGVGLVVDCAHGAAFELGPALFRRLGADLVVLGAAPDGRNINDGVGVFHVDDVLVPEIRRTGAALGLALDGDADRVLLVDETGTVRDGDHMLGLLATDLDERAAIPGRRLVTTVMANLGLQVFLSKTGITCETTPVGDRFVATRMHETGAILGGEQSGHIIFRDGERWYGDGLYTALRVLEVMRRRAKPLSALCAGIEKYPQELVNVRVGSKPPVDRVPELMAACRAAEEDLGDEGRVVLRYSGTEPLLRVMVEARDQAKVGHWVAAIVDAARRGLGAS